MPHRPWLLPLLFAVLIAGAWYFGFRAKGADRELPVYVTGAERMLAGEEIYRRGTDDKAFTYPPFAAVPFLPLTLLPLQWQAPLWFAVNFVVLLLVAAWLRRWLRRVRAGPGGAIWLWFVVLLVAGRHLLSVFENQSNDLLVLGVVTLVAAAWSRGGDLGRLAAGACAGLGGAFKATPLLFLELFALRRTWRGVVGALAAFALLSWLPDLLWPRHDGGSWVVAWYQVNLRGLDVAGTAAVEGAWGSHSILNQSLSGTLTRLLSPTQGTGPFVRDDLMLFAASSGLLHAAILGARLLVVGLIGFGVLRARRALGASGDPVRAQWRLGLGECGLVVLGMVLLSPQSSKSHFCVLVLPALFCAERMFRGRRDPLLWLLMAVVAVLSAVTVKDVLGRQVGNFVLGLGCVTWSALLLLLATLRALRDPGPSSGDDSTGSKEPG